VYKLGWIRKLIFLFLKIRNFVTIISLTGNFTKVYCENLPKFRVIYTNFAKCERKFYNKIVRNLVSIQVQRKFFLLVYGFVSLVRFFKFYLCNLDNSLLYSVPPQPILHISGFIINNSVESLRILSV
jgi:hypothetical protein